MEKYKFIDEITSDVMFEAYGEAKKDVFVNAALALFSVMCNIDIVKSEFERKIVVEAESVDDLMINWLQALIASVDIEEMFFSKFVISEFSDTKLVAFIYGEEISKEKGKTVVKAVTYHQYEFKKTSFGYSCRVSLDI